jgi:hypothetical protein
MIRFLLLCAYCLFGLGLLAQPKNKTERPLFYLKNPSLEGRSGEGSVPIDWLGCGGNSTSDVLPGAWGVTTAAHEGKTFLGLVTREDGTWEMLSQQLSQPLLQGGCYQFTVFLAQSKQYAGYNKQPACLRIWGGNRPCERKQLLCTSPPVGHAEWKAYELNFTAQEQWQYITIEAYYQPGVLFYYRSNLLIDAFSPFEPCLRA